MDNKKIGIVTVLYNSQTVIYDFFESLAKQTYTNIIFYVVDNNSPDASVLECKKYESKLSFPVKYILNTENYGVAKGNNQGIKAALIDGCDYVLLSNNDVVLNENTLLNLYLGLLQEKALLAVPKIYFYNTKKIWAAGGSFNKKRALTLHRGYNEIDEGQYDFNSSVDYGSTCFMLIDRKVFDDVGYMDEKYFVYYDDTDFIYRVTQLKKLRLVYIYNSFLEHKESVCTGKKSDFYYHYIYRNRMYFVKKYYNNWRKFYFGELIANYTIRLIRMSKCIKQWNIVRKAVKEGYKL